MIEGRTMTDVFMKQSNFYANPSQEELDALTRSLDIYIMKGLTTKKTRDYVIKMAKLYLEEIEDE